MTDYWVAREVVSYDMTKYPPEPRWELHKERDSGGILRHMEYKTQGQCEMAFGEHRQLISGSTEWECVDANPSPGKSAHKQEVIKAIMAGQDYFFVYYDTAQGWIGSPDSSSYVSRGECEQAREEAVAARQVVPESKCIARAELARWLNKDRLGQHYVPYAHKKYLVIGKDAQGWFPATWQLYASKDECARDVAATGYAIGPDLKCVRESDLEQWLGKP